MPSDHAAITPTWDHDAVRIAASDQVLSRAIDDELVLYHPATDKVTHLDAIAAQVWSRISSELTVGALISGLATDFDTDRATIAVDVSQLLDELFDARLVQVT